MSKSRFAWFEIPGRHDGDAIVFTGHGIDVEEIRRDLCTENFEFAEMYFRFIPRLKWCERFGAWPCDFEGEWHSHYIPVKPNPDYAITIAWEV